MLILTVMLFFGTTFAWGQQVQWLKYHSDREAYSIASFTGYQSLTINEEKPKDIELPEFMDEKPLFARWFSPLAKDGFLWIALERSEQTGPYDRLYIDSNGDGSLRDKEVVKADQADSYNSTFSLVRVVFAGDDGPIIYDLNFDFFNLASKKELLAYAGGWYEGEIEVGGEKMNCVLFDNNVNGTFNDKSLDPDQCDRICIGQKRDPGASFVGHYREIDGVLYQLEITPDGANIKLTPATDKTFGNVKLPESTTEIDVGGENGFFIRKPEKGMVKLPEGKYRVHHWAMERTDDQGILWNLEGTSSGDQGIFEISRISETILAIGEPIIATLEVSQSTDSIYTFNHSIKGPAGENIRLTRYGVGDKPPPPRVHIKNVDGSYNRTFYFAYG